MSHADPMTLPTVAPVPDILADLEWRGLLALTTDREALARDLSSGPMTLYCGFDPTGDSLHLGSLVPLLALRRFQLAGHRPIALAGGATGFIGDPSGRTSERTLQTPDVIAVRVRLLRAQMEHFLDFSGDNAAVLVDNLDWTAGIGKFSRALEIRPDDSPSRVYLARCREYAETPPPPDWDAVVSLTTK